MKVTQNDWTYTGNEIKPEVELVVKDETTGKEIDVTNSFLISIQYSNNINAGTATVSAEISGYYVTDEDKFVGTESNSGEKRTDVIFSNSESREKTANFTIKAAEISNCSVNLDQSSYTYDGTSKTPEVTVTYNGKTLVKGTDYTVSYAANQNVSKKAIVTVKGTGNYQGTLEKYFTINAASISEVLLSTTSYTYSGSAITPAPTVKCGSKVLKKDTDYTVSYANNKNAGTATVTVTGKGNYSGTRTKNFTINKAALSKLILSKTSYTYNGAALKPGTTVTASNGKTLKKDTDYTVTYTNNKNAGTATVTVTGKGNYSGTKKATFTIARVDLSKATIKLTGTKYTYNGKDKKPGVTATIKLSSKVTLKKNTDYTISYSKNCKSIGKKTVTITGKGNYKGTIKKTYSVVPEKGTGLKISKRTTSSLTVTCTKAKVSGSKYQFRLMQYNSKTGKWEEKASKKTSSNSCTFSGLSAGRAYNVYVRIYKSVDSKTYTGSWSNCTKTITAPAKPVLSFVTRSASTTVKATWKAVSSATGYEVQYSTNPDFSSAKTVKVEGRTTTSKSISKLSSSKTYYVRVRAYRTYNDKTYRGAWSSKQSTVWSNVYASYTTTYNTGNTNRSTNLRLACQAINGKILVDGETFSFNGIVGERTAAKGYREAIIYESGQEVGGIGGGICQVATTLFNAALKANFTIVERYQHSLTVHYAPLGYDAAIAWGSKNLRFRNDSGVSVKVSAVASGGTLQVKFLTNTYKKPPTVTTKVTKRNGVYTLKRYVNGKCNYTTTSNYLDD